MDNWIHPTDSRWDDRAQAFYRDAYPELTAIFQQLISRAFLRCHWIANPLALEYLTKILIRFLPYSGGKDDIERAPALGEITGGDPRDRIRVYESAGELILWWSGIHRKSLFKPEGKRSYEIAYEWLSGYEVPQRRIIVQPGQEENVTSKRLRINKMFSEQFENYQELLEKSELIEDPAYIRYRNLFLTDDFSIN